MLSILGFWDWYLLSLVMFFSLILMAVGIVAVVAGLTGEIKISPKRRYSIIIILISIVYLLAILGCVGGYLDAMSTAEKYKGLVGDLARATFTYIKDTETHLANADRYLANISRYLSDTARYTKEGNLEGIQASLLNASDSLNNVSAAHIDILLRFLPFASYYLNETIDCLDKFENAHRLASSCAEGGLMATIIFLIILYFLIRKYKSAYIA